MAGKTDETIIAPPPPADAVPDAAPVAPFWEAKRLDEMTDAEWESLCDGCGRCCIVLLEDTPEEDRFLETNVCCRLFDAVTRRCTRYAERHRLVPDCISVTPKNAGALPWMPDSCAYRRLAEGKGLAPWHPLRSGRAESVAEAGIAVSPDLVSEREVRPRDLWRHVIGRRGR